MVDPGDTIYNLFAWNMSLAGVVLQGLINAISLKPYVPGPPNVAGN